MEKYELLIARRHGREISPSDVSKIRDIVSVFADSKYVESLELTDITNLTEGFKDGRMRTRVVIVKQDRMWNYTPLTKSLFNNGYQVAEMQESHL